MKWKLHLVTFFDSKPAELYKGIHIIGSRQLNMSVIMQMFDISSIVSFCIFVNKCCATKDVLGLRRIRRTPFRCYATISDKIML